MRIANNGKQLTNNPRPPFRHFEYRGKLTSKLRQIFADVNLESTSRNPL
jgi:hypothetical protein